MADYNTDEGGDFLGLGIQYKNVVSDVQGLSGFSLTLAINAQIEVATPPGIPARGVTITLDYSTNDGLSRVILYDPQIRVYPRKLPTGVPITITAAGPLFFPQTQTFTLSDTGFQAVYFLLVFRESYARIVKKRFI